MVQVIDLFSGVGGMSLGATLAGCSLAGAIELDPIAISTHEVNFPNSKHLKSDISALSGKVILEEFKLKQKDLTGIIGGPPCQGFSSMGKGDIDDPRNSLFLHYFRLIKELQPEFFVAENVPGILRPKYDNIRENAFSQVEDKYEILEPIVLSAKDLGVPTTRTRVFFIGFRKGSFYRLNKDDFAIANINNNYVGDALLGLPAQVNIDGSEWTEINKIKGHYYTQMLSNNLPEGVGNPDAIARYLNRNEVSGMMGTLHTKEVIQRFSAVVPGSSDRISKAPRLKIDGYCPTLRAGTGSDKGSFQAVRPIHPSESRVITPREAARIQGFPDWFQFHNTKWHSFRQIGNSVSPFVSQFLLRRIIEKLG